MFISGVGEDIEGGQGISEATDHREEFQTATELFDLMTNNYGFEFKDGEGLTTQDLVLLYQNIDIGTKLMNTANEARKPNQYVETVVYNDDADSDSEISYEDVPNVFKINQERLNFFSNGSLENILCHKLGGLEIQMSDLTTQYDRHFFKDPFVKEQLKNIFDIDPNDLKTVLPTSLLDFICCKRLDDNYNFYMDNIITYVQRTIEQLKRISNGDYLTDRTKEKWREVTAKCSQEISTLSKASCIPLHVGCKDRNITAWNEIVHSAIDVRSLSRILKKKIVVEIPKIICGSFRVFGKRYANNLVISCKREKKIKHKKNNEISDDSRLDVVVQLKRSETGRITAKVSSIMMLQTATEVPTKEAHTPEILLLPSASEMLPLPYKEEKEMEHESESCEATTSTMSYETYNRDTSDPIVITGEVDQGNLEKISNNDSNCTDSDYCGFYDVAGNEFSSASSSGQKETSVSKHNPETPSHLTSPDELHYTMQRLNIQTVLPEESIEDLTGPRNKKKSLQRIRVKSPYENKLFAMEERKRKRLLEIRERREKRKQALSENCKISKNKYCKFYAAQPSSSVTKLSITNKSFYNSIYGENLNLENNSNKSKPRKTDKKNNPLALDVSLEVEAIPYDSPNVTPERYGKQYINRSYYLDEAETEIDNQMKQSENNKKQTGSTSTSTINNDFHANSDLFNHFIQPTFTNIEKIQSLSCHDITHNNSVSEVPEIIVIDEVTEAPQTHIKIQQRTAKKTPNMKHTHESKPPVSTVECRKSIEKLYDLMRKSKKPNKVDFKTSTTKLGFGKPEIAKNSTAQGTSSGTSIRNHPTSSNSSLCNLEKTADIQSQPTDKSRLPAPVVPKVIISSKQILKNDSEKMKKDRKKLNNHPVVTKVLPENPLRAISQLLQEFDHVQKNRQRFVPDNKGLRKAEIVSNEVRNSKRPSREVNLKRRSRFDQLLNAKDIEQDRNKSFAYREKRRPATVVDVSRNLHQPFEEKNIQRNNIVKKKLMDIIEEVKEARGEAIRGPSKPNSRLSTLAQPKKAYVQAHSEDYQSKYGRNLMADRLQRLAGATALSKSDRYISSVNSRLKARRNGAEAMSNDDPIKAVSTSSPSQNIDKSFKPIPPHQMQITNRPSARNSIRTTARSIHRGCPIGTPPKSPARSNSRSPVQSPKCSPRRSPTRKPSTLAQSPDTCIHSIPESPEVRSKMEAVESYVKNHYGLKSQLNTQLLQTGHKSRVPFVPKDMTAVLTSSSNAGEANELGNALHSMIESIIDTNNITDDECQISNKDHFSVPGTRTDSDFKMDVFEDKNLETAVNNVTVFQKDDKKPVEVSESRERQLKSFNSKTELEKLETALYNQMSSALQKRLRIKNLTLTPKQSMQNVYLLQSGDAGSLLVKSVTEIKLNKCDENLQELKPLPVLLDNEFKFDFMQIPPQQKTVGFALTKHLNEKNRSLSDIKSLSDAIRSRPSTCGSNKSDKVIQCFKGIPEDRRQENAVQVVVGNEIPISVRLDINKTEIEMDQSTRNIGTSQDLSGNNQIALPKKYKNRKAKTNNKTLKDSLFKNNNSVKDTIVKDSIKKYNSEDDYVVKDSEVSKNNNSVKDTNVNDKINKNDCEDGYVVNDSDIISMVQTSTVEGVEPLDRKPKCHKCIVAEKSTSAEYTSSLDMLVGLLNEIQKITCQTPLCSSCTDFNTILMDAAAKETVGTGPQELRVVSSIEKIKKLDSKPNIYSLYMSAKDCMRSSSQDINISINKSVYVDKEVNVDIEKNMVTAFTEASSKIFPITINHSTTVTNSLIGVLSQSSSQSINSFNTYQSLCSNKMFDSQSMKNIEISPNDVKEIFKIPLNHALDNSKTTSIEPHISAAAVLPLHNNDIKKIKVNKLIGSCKEFDPVLKIKRDILVTMYSILVLTVFAALSFPELMMTNII